MASSFEDCPFECPKSKKRFDLQRHEFCDVCPKKRQRDIFKQQTEDYCEVKLGRVAKKYSFETLLKTVYQVGSLLDLTAEKLSVRAAYLVSIYRTEKTRAKVTDD